MNITSCTPLRELNDGSVIVWSEKMSDGSVGYLVTFDDSGESIKFACSNLKHANALADQLTECAWVEVTQPKGE